MPLVVIGVMAILTAFMMEQARFARVCRAPTHSPASPQNCPEREEEPVQHIQRRV
jgi:hypothetical protein